MKSWSSTQAIVATWSGEVEHKALAWRAAEALGLKAVLDELGWEMPIEIMIDSAAAQSMGCPVGLGKAAAHRGEAVVGAGSGSTTALPHHKDY